MKSTWSTNLCWPWYYPQKWAKTIQKESKTSVFDSFVTESVISVNVDGSPSRVWTYDPPVNSRMLYRWANEEYNAATTYPPGQLPDKYFRRSEA